MDSQTVIDTLTPVVPGAAYEAAASVDFPTIYVPADRLLQTCVALREIPALGFNVPYAVGNTLLTLAGPLLVALIQ